MSNNSSHARTNYKFTTDPEFAFTLPSEFYTSPAIYKKELECVFANSWNYACHMTQVESAGQWVKFKIAEEELYVVRGQDGQLRAFYNVCKHRAHRLVTEDSGESSMITCPYHAWSYDLEGNLQQVRNESNLKNFCKDDFKLSEAKVEEYMGFVWVNLDMNADPLREQAPGLEEMMLEYVPELKSMKFAKRISWDINCNWKTAIENFSECYHCAPAHPALVELLDMEKYNVTCHDIWNVHVGPVYEPEEASISYTPTERPQDYIGGMLWPNVTIWIMPGSANIAFLYMVPTGPETCREHMDFFFVNETPSEEEQEYIDYMKNVLQPEDINLCEEVQMGLRSRSYDIGRVCVDAERSGISEHAVHHFQEMVRKAHAKMPGVEIFKTDR